MPWAGLLDRRQALHVDPRAVGQGALGEQVAGRVAADVARVGGQVEELVGRAEDDLRLLDRRAVALEAVVDATADDPAAELSQRPANGRPAAEHGRTMLEGDLVGREVLQAGERERRAGAELDLGRAGEEGLRLAAVTPVALEAPSVAAGRPAPRRRTTSASSPIEMIVRDSRRRSGAPTAQRRTIGRSRRERRRGRGGRAPASRGPASSGRACRSRAGAAALEEAAQQIRVAAAQRRRASPGPRRRREPRARARAPSRGSRRIRRKRPLPRGAASRRRVGSAAPRAAAGPGDTAARRPGRALRRSTYVRVERVRLDRQRLEGAQPGQAIREEPVGVGRAAAATAARSPRRRRSGSGPRAPAGPARLRSSRRAAASAAPLGGHPSEPSISSLTRRLNSMAYSIGSSLVKTSRKPWTTRFVASFSVRPRLIR